MPSPPISLCMAVNNLDVGGLERLVISLLARLPRDRFDLSVICLSGRGKLFSEVDLPASAFLVLDKPPVVSGMVERVRAPAYMRRVARFLRERRVEILYAHNLAPLLYTGLPARMMSDRPHVVYAEHNQIYRASPWGLRKFREYVRLADDVVAVSHDLERSLLEKIKVTRPVQVIHNGIDGTRFGVSDGAVRRELGIPEGAFVLGTAVVLTEQKGITYLLDAAKLVLREAPAITFLIAGDGPLRAELEAKARASELGDSVRFLGYRKDVPALIASLDAYVLPSLWEGLPLALLEAMAQGLPLVATAVGGNPEVVEHGANGFLVPPRDSRALAEHILRIHREPELRQAARQTNQRKFAAEFSLEAMLRRYVAFFEERAETRRSARRAAAR